MLTNIHKNTKVFYRHINRIRKVKERIGPIKDKNNRILYKDKQMAQEFVKHYENMFTESRLGDTIDDDEAKALFDLNNTALSTALDINTLENIHITSNTVQAAIKSMNAGKAPGMCGLDIDTCKKLSEVISEPLAEIYTKAIRDGTDIEQTYTAIITPAFKSGSKAKCSQYRPILNLGVRTKIMGKIIQNRYKST